MVTRGAGQQFPDVFLYFSEDEAVGTKKKLFKSVVPSVLSFTEGLCELRSSNKNRILSPVAACLSENKKEPLEIHTEASSSIQPFSSHRCTVVEIG